MLWDAIYDFFVKNIFGGYTSGLVQYAGFMGTFRGGSNYFTSTFNVSVFGQDMAIGNYFSLVATIISIILILVACVMFVVKMVKLVGNLVK